MKVGVALWLLAGAAAVTLWLFADSLAEWVAPTCAWRHLTGHACPTCGVTRAFQHLAHGEWTASLAAHPLALPLVLQAIGAWLLWGMWLLGANGPFRARRSPRPDRWIPRAIAVNAAALVIVWLVRAGVGLLPR